LLQDVFVQADCARDVADAGFVDGYCGEHLQGGGEAVAWWRCLMGRGRRREARGAGG